ncbi:phosphopantetheine-binding protein [Streptomyces sp. NBC_01622]|uniref:phosphopantetheine-binding protein n=1 Tax=Streptomyces sp. NBC_01622 TaxID=2975903 RepID=UPI00386EF5E9|nr:phosphopantetheine-binding protein [Streptomyces sp. NBC_01622]
MEETTAVLEPAVREILLPLLGPSTDPAAIGPDTDLWQAGLDSLGSVSLMAGLEDTFGIEFPDALLTRETFSTLGRIVTALDGLVRS